MRPRSRRRPLAVAAVIVAALTSACTAASHPATTSSPTAHGAATGTLAARAAALDAALTAARSSFPTGAFTAAVVSDGGTWSAATGVDGTGTPLTAQTESEVGSITKTFTAAELVHLASIGRVDLDAPTARYVTSPLTANHATIRQTLSMTSGVRDGQMIAQFQAAVSDSPEQATTPRTQLAYASEPLAATGAPGEYSNAGYLLLGEVIERVTGLPYAAAIRRDLITPAGLHRVAVQSTEKPTAPVAYPAHAGETPVTDGWLPDRATAGAVGGAGSIAADAPDVARWGYDLYAAHTVLPAADVATMTTFRSLKGLYGLGTEPWAASDTGLDVPTVGHAGDIYRITADAEKVWYTAQLLVDPTDHVSVAVLTPSDTPQSAMVKAAASFIRAARGR